MKTLPSGMQVDLDAGATTYCLCWKLTRTDATVMGFTDHDKNLTFDGVTYHASTGVNSSAAKSSTGLQIDDVTAEGALSSDAITEEDISKKLYDNAAIEVMRVDWTDSTKRVVIFSGYMGEVTRGRIGFNASVHSLAKLLNQPTGQLYQKTCNANLGDSRCKVDFDSNPAFRIDGTVSQAFSRRLFSSTDFDILAQATGWFSAGKITWLTGDNTGYSVEIKSHILQSGDSEAWIDMWEAMPSDIQAGDTYTLQVGCDKTVGTCRAKFDNVVNMRGFPRMPSQDLMTSFATTKDRNDGTSWYT